jgi:hypothetical protein
MPIISQPSRNTAKKTVSTAITSPKLNPRHGSILRAASPKMFRVAKPNRTAHNML